MAKDDRERACVAGAMEALKTSGSWTGRTHLHKHLFTTRILGLADVPFEFELYHYGPYSFELDGVVAEMTTYGEIDKEYRRPGYGPSYGLTALGREALDQLTREETRVMNDVAAHLKHFDASDLELIATCLWVTLNEDESDAGAVLKRVQEIKPKYSANRIRRALERTLELRQAFEHRPRAM